MLNREVFLELASSSVNLSWSGNQETVGVASNTSWTVTPASLLELNPATVGISWDGTGSATSNVTSNTNWDIVTS